MDIESVLQTKIPDLTPVYGGVRGRTLSSSHQAYAWRAMKEAGLKQVIDLRQDYMGDRYKNDCEKNGVAYFHYPVHKGKESIANMVMNFDMFCELIDRGDFFISCAQGLHRTDIALCTYWVFYGADKGKEPPVLVGYLKENGHDTGKIFHVLNSFYDYLTEQNGIEPLPIKVFKERKGIIHQMSQSITREQLIVEAVQLLYDYMECLASTEELRSKFAKICQDCKICLFEAPEWLSKLMREYADWPRDEDKAWDRYDSEDGSTWFTSEVEFRHDIMKALQTLRDKGEFTDIIQTDYSKYLR